MEMVLRYGFFAGPEDRATQACDPSAEACGVCSREGRTSSGLSSFPAGSPKAINAIFFMG